jgi:uracil-DNA glycosylase family 4
MPKASPQDFKERLARLQGQVMRCTQCPRLVEWRRCVAEEKTRRYHDCEYWGRPVPSFGDSGAQLLLVGLAPAAHGGNRTGRMFTGDRSGEWLYRALWEAGFANQPTSVHQDDGLALKNCYISAAARCAPPANKPSPEELERCRPFLIREIELLHNLRVVVALGRIGFDAVIKAFKHLGRVELVERPKFSHGGEWKLNARTTLIASFHPSQQNTFTGRLTRPMFNAIFRRVREILNGVDVPCSLKG